MLLDLPEQEKSERGLEHTPREIWQQPATWSKTYERCRDRGAELNDVLRRAGIGRGSTSSPTVYLLGAGTSDYTGRVLAPLLRRRWSCDVWAIPSTTMLTEFEEYHRPGREYLWISFSRSGESPEGVALLERALDRHREIRHLLITCNHHGPMAELCSRNPDRALALILDDAVNDRGLAMTSSFTNMVLAGQCVAQFGGPCRIWRTRLLTWRRLERSFFQRRRKSRRPLPCWDAREPVLSGRERCERWPMNAR